MRPEAAIHCERLVKVYPSVSGRVQAVRGVDLDFEYGATAALVGPSGCGKSSLLRMLAGLDVPTAGLVTAVGINLFTLSKGRRSRVRADHITHVYQQPSDNLVGHLTSIQQLQRVARHGADRCMDPDEAIELFGLAARRDRVSADLSGGEQQRLAFAKALAAGHSIVIADEPTAQLDRHGVAATLDAISAMKERGMSVITATHDPRVLERTDQVVRMRDGAISTVTEGGTELAVIDRSGRLQLPPAVEARFPSRRVTLTVDEPNGLVIIGEQPDSGESET